MNVLAQMFGARSPPGAVLDPWDFQDPASSPPGECRVIKITDEVRAKDAAERAAREATTAPAWTIKPELSVENLRRKATQKPIAPAKPAATRARRGPRLAQVPIPVPVAPETRVDAALPRGPVTVPEATPSSAQRARVAEKRAAAAEKERKTVLLAATLEEYEADQVWAALSGEDKLALLDIAGGGGSGCQVKSVDRIQDQAMTHHTCRDGVTAKMARGIACVAITRGITTTQANVC